MRRGIGAAIAKRLAADGADVIISYSASPDRAAEVVKEIEKAGGKAVSIKADQSNSAEVVDLVKTASKKFGKLDILVNNAGVFALSAATDENADLALLRHMFAVNVEGVATAVRAAANILEDDGRIINIGSVVGDRVPFGGAADYSATKAAVALYSQGWARDFAPRRITVNTVQPGPIDTEMNPADSEMAAGFKTMIPLGRYGKADEIAAAVAFLASPDASYITGTSLTVDGGLNA